MGPPLPRSETKNTVVHGSQADSGVFTLGSNKTNANQQNGNAHPNQTQSNDVDSWPTSHSNSSDEQAYDFSNDPYLQEIAANLAVNGEEVVVVDGQHYVHHQQYYDGYTGHRISPNSGKF